MSPWVVSLETMENTSVIVVDNTPLGTKLMGVVLSKDC
jgi:hypothetical protein